MTPQDYIRLHRHTLTPIRVQSQHGEPVIAAGEGAYLIDVNGTRMLDFSSGWLVTTLGHGHPTIIAAIQEQLDKICWSPPNYVNDMRALYSAALSELSPWAEGCRTYFTTGGSEANEAAVQTARTLTGRAKILATYNSFHGTTLGAAAITGANRRWASEPYLPGNVVRFWAPFPYRSPFYTDDPKVEVERAIEHLERVLKHENPDSVAAIIMEPCVGSGGIVVYPDGYLEAVRALTERQKILLIFDEVITGFGRVGEAFAALRFNVTPDMITFAKSASAAYVPLGGMMLRESLARSFDRRSFDIGQTHSGYPLGMAAGLGTLRAAREEKLFQRAYTVEKWIRDAFTDLAAKHPSIGDVRGVGAFFGVDLVSDRSSRAPIVPQNHDGIQTMRQFYGKALKAGVMLHGRHNTLLITPPLVMTEKQFRDGIEIIDSELFALERQVGITAKAA